MRNTLQTTVTAALLLALIGTLAVDEPLAATTYGSLRGTVVDEAGDALPGVTVVLRSESAVRERAVQTDRNGKYFAIGLAPGDYTVLARLAGFGTIQQTTTIRLDAETVLNFQLPEGELTETVTVVSERAIVSRTQTENSYNLRKDFTEKIPIGRSYQSLLALAPGVSNTSENGGNPNVLGSTRNENTYLLDGVSISDAVTGTFGSNINYDSIEEVDLKLTGVSAEYGQFQGGLSNVITKSGGNDFTGSLRDEITSPSFESRYDRDTLSEFSSPPADTPPRGDRELSHDVEATLGGPIVRNSAWFFISYNRSDTVGIEQLGNPTGGVNGDGTYVDTFEGDNSNGKLTWQATDSHKLQYNYFEDPALTPRCYGEDFFGGPCYDTPFVDNQQQGGFAWTGTWNAVWTPRVFTDVRISHWENSFNISPLTPQTIRPDLIFESPGGLGAGLAAGHPATIAGGSVLFDAPIFASVPEVRERDQYEVKTTSFISTEHGSHTLKIGADYQEATREGASIISGNALAYFDFVTPPPGLGGNGDPYDIDNRVYDFFIDFAPPGDGGPVSKETALYVQDDWALNENWALNLGLRWERFQEENDVGEEVIDQNAFAPRLGATYDVQANGKHLLKATAARYNAGVKLTTLSPFVRAAGGQSAYDVYFNDNLSDFTCNISGASCVDDTDCPGVGDFCQNQGTCTIGGTPCDTDDDCAPGDTCDFSTIVPFTANDAGTPDWALLFGARPDPTTSVFSPDLEPQRIDEFTIGYETALSTHWGLKIRYVDREWDNIIGQQFSYDYSSGSPSQILFMDNVSGIERTYRGVFLELEKRYWNNWTLRGNVAVGETEGNDESGVGFSTYNSYEARIDPVTGLEDPAAPLTSVPQTVVNRQGTLSYNEDTAIKLFGSYSIPLPQRSRHSLEVGGTFNWSSGNNYADRALNQSVVVGPGADGVLDCFNASDPYLGLGTPGTAACAALDQTANVTEFFEPRGSREEPDVWSIDILTRYRFSFGDRVNFESRFEVRNLTDEQEVLDVNTNSGPSFGEPNGFPGFQNARRYLFNAALLW